MNTRHCLIALLLLPLAACNKSDGAEKPAAGKSASAPVARSLSSADVIKAQIQPLAATIPFTGSLTALASSAVAAEVDANVREVKVREGEAVRRGQLLAVLDAEALGQSVEEQNAQLDNTKSRLKLAKVKLDKQRELLGKGFISQVAYDELESDYRVKEGELRAQASQVARAKRLLQDTQVKAPIDGVVFERKINPGEVASRNMKLFSIANLSVLEIAATVPSRLVSQVRVGMDASFSVDGRSELQHGEVVRINPVAIPGTRSFTLFIRVQNPAGQLKVGQFAKGGVVLRAVKDQVVVPLSSVRDIDSQPWLMVAEKGKLVKKPVTVQLRAENERQAAVAGIAPGASVIVGELLGSKIGDAVGLPGGQG
ncbi:efflux RND transporter periplasmic adaptor subunit [Chromobacterium subtsugae]|nr:efflux RND transporter periplasmic adaptor subunit [Chromobacterium subtsugae]KUM04052.1 RND transporter [Chromobacterium subtsugae]OBU84428.1 RND transporter [Chromobacterium subtsugae]WSE90219.1 efflux RND transporter periplasmic adaptor subunit [Chromobacterium subtsugae]WVH58591.1 efflux RND transporter periplasmic adaptor subunit [Chromobacterium subtsugae]